MRAVIVLLCGGLLCARIASFGDIQTFVMSSEKDQMKYLLWTKSEEMIDLDQDGLPDAWEQQIIDADPTDRITSIEDVVPEHDYDRDGITNREEYLNAADPTVITEIVVDITVSDLETTDPLAEIRQYQTVRMDLQFRLHSDHRPAALERTFTLLADGGGRFQLESNCHLWGWCLPNDYPGSLTKWRAFSGSISAITDEAGRFAIDMQAARPGHITFTIEELQYITSWCCPRLHLEMVPVRVPYLTAVWEGRRLQEQESVRIRLADLAEAIHPEYSSAASPNWELEGTIFSEIIITPHGYLLLVPNYSEQPPVPITDFDHLSWETAPDHLLAPFLEPLVMKPESRIYVNWNWLTEPYMVVQWCRMGRAGDPDASLSFQIQLWQESHRLRFSYHAMRDGSGNAILPQGALIGAKFDADRIYAWDGPLPSVSGLELADPRVPGVEVTAIDADADGLSLEEEAAAGTNPNHEDSDGDLMADNWEVMFAGPDPLRPDAEEDSDGDGYTNLIEYYLGASPDDPESPSYCGQDTDMDGLPNSWEWLYGFDPDDPRDALEDADYDWYTTVLEYAVGGDPLDPLSQGTHPAEPEGGLSHAFYPPLSPASR